MERVALGTYGIGTAEEIDVLLIPMVHRPEGKPLLPFRPPYSSQLFHLPQYLYPATPVLR